MVSQPKHEAKKKKNKVRNKKKAVPPQIREKEKCSLSEEMLHHLVWLQSNRKSKKYQS